MLLYDPPGHHPGRYPGRPRQYNEGAAEAATAAGALLKEEPVHGVGVIWRLLRLNSGLVGYVGQFLFQKQHDLIGVQEWRPANVELLSHLAYAFGKVIGQLQVGLIGGCRSLDKVSQLELRRGGPPLVV